MFPAVLAFCVVFLFFWFSCCSFLGQCMFVFMPPQAHPYDPMDTLKEKEQLAHLSPLSFFLVTLLHTSTFLHAVPSPPHPLWFSQLTALSV